jgi:hypothetical protein
MTKTFRVCLWFGKTARGGGSRQGAPASYGEYTETIKFRVRDLNLVKNSLEETARLNYPRSGRLKLYRVQVEG